MEKTWAWLIGESKAATLEVEASRGHCGFACCLTWYGDADKGAEIVLQFLWFRARLWVGRRYMLDMHPPALFDVGKRKLWWVKVTNLLIFRADLSSQSVGLGAHVLAWSRDLTGYSNARFGGDVALQLLWLELGVHLDGGVDREDAVGSASHPLFAGGETHNS